MHPTNPTHITDHSFESILCGTSPFLDGNSVLQARLVCRHWNNHPGIQRALQNLKDEDTSSENAGFPKKLVQLFRKINLPLFHLPSAYFHMHSLSDIKINHPLTKLTNLNEYVGIALCLKGHVEAFFMPEKTHPNTASTIVKIFWLCTNKQSSAQDIFQISLTYKKTCQDEDPVGHSLRITGIEQTANWVKELLLHLTQR